MVLWRVCAPVFCWGCTGGDQAAFEGLETVSVLFELHNVRKRYATFEALKGITVQVEAGTIGLLGPNGAGKSTLIKTLLGLLQFEEGSATVLGRNLPHEAAAIRRSVGYMPENDCYLPRMTAVQYVTYAGQLCGMPRRDAFQRAHETLHYVGLGEARYRRLGTFSTGMKQRVKLAQALIHGPKLVFLDEPTNGLDPEGRDQMLELIMDVASRGISVMLSTHILYDVEKTCSRALLLNRGALVHYGDIGAMKDDSKNNFEVRVHDKSQAFVQALRDRGATIDDDRGNLVVVSLPSGHDTDFILQVAVDTGAQIRHMVPYNMTLETAFLDIIREHQAKESGQAQQ